MVKLYSIEIDKISNLDILSSFLIIDDVFVSEADKNGTDMGYIAINDSKRVEDLLLKFNGLKHIGVSV